MQDFLEAQASLRYYSVNVSRLALTALVQLIPAVQLSSPHDRHHGWGFLEEKRKDNISP